MNVHLTPSEVAHVCWVTTRYKSFREKRDWKSCVLPKQRFTMNSEDRRTVVLRMVGGADVMKHIPPGHGFQMDTSGLFLHLHCCMCHCDCPDKPGREAARAQRCDGGVHLVWVHAEASHWIIHKTRWARSSAGARWCSALGSLLI